MVLVVEGEMVNLRIASAWCNALVRLASSQRRRDCTLLRPGREANGQAGRDSRVCEQSRKLLVGLAMFVRTPLLSVQAE